MAHLPRAGYISICNGVVTLEMNNSLNNSSNITQWLNFMSYLPAVIVKTFWSGVLTLATKDKSIRFSTTVTMAHVVPCNQGFEIPHRALPPHAKPTQQTTSQLSTSKKKKDYQMALLRTLAELSSPRYDSMRGFSMYSSVHDTVILPSTDHC